MYQFWKKRSLHMLIVSAVVLLSSCIEGYHDDWTFSAGVTNTTLVSPDSAHVTFSKNLAGDLVVSWPVVYGAGGYQFSLYIVDDPNNPVPVGTEGELVDGCTVTRPLLEETRYKVVIKTLGNTRYNNKDAEKSTVVPYSTLLPAYALIPDGTDLYQYFTTAVIPDSTKEVIYDLVAGGQYTLSGPVDFQKHWIALRGDKINHPTITYGTLGRLRITAGFTLKYLDVDCNAVGADVTDGAMILMSANPNPAILSTANNSYYIIQNDVLFSSCKFKNINRRLIFDANVKYCIANLTIKDCIIGLNTLNDGSGGVIYMQGGFVNNFTIMKSTVYGKAQTAGYFLRYNNSGRPDRAGFASGSINFLNNTFYNVVYSGQMGNYSGMNSALVKLSLRQNIFADCGSSAVVRRLSVSSTSMVRVNFGFNCFRYNNLFPEDTEITPTYGDKSGTHINDDPSFKDPANGDFTVGASATKIISGKSGDPRWLPAN